MGFGEIGQSVLWLTLAVAAYGVCAALASRYWRRAALLESARNAALGVAALAAVAAALLVAAFLGHDFSLRYVAENSTRDAPVSVTLTGFWGGQPGSLLFWACGMALLVACAVAIEFRRFRALMPAFLATACGVECFFFFVLAAVANPFETLPNPLADGRGLNPLLWDNGMRIHPPLLLSGYMSFTVPFALTIGALAAGRLGADWLPAIRRWMLLSWTIQGAGLLAGAWWAYHVLGWGGYWGWDPVENVALLPWLTATAFLHSLMVQERRGMLKTWNVALVVASFCLAIFGTFIVRSGLLSSVHTFAQSNVGPYFFAFLAVVVLGSLWLLLFRLPQLQAEAQFDAVVSRESGFLLNNLLLVGIAVATFWGTVFPLVATLATGAKVSVGAPFFQQVNGPLLLALLALMGAGPLLAWRRTSAATLWQNFRWPLLVALVASATLAIFGIRKGLALLSFAAALFTVATIWLEYWRGLHVRRSGALASGEREWIGASLLQLVAHNRRRYGGYIVHLAMVFIACGIVGSHFYQVESVATLAPGESMTAGRYALTYRGLGTRTQPGTETEYAEVALREGDRDLGSVTPERRVHRNWEQQPVTGVALQTTRPWLDDVYVLLAGWDDSGNATLRVFVNPLVSLIWCGAPLFLVGTLICAWPEAARRRQVQTVPSWGALTGAA